MNCIFETGLIETFLSSRVFPFFPSFPFSHIIFAIWIINEKPFLVIVSPYVRLQCDLDFIFHFVLCFGIGCFIYHRCPLIRLQNEPDIVMYCLHWLVVLAPSLLFVSEHTAWDLSTFSPSFLSSTAASSNADLLSNLIFSLLHSGLK